MRRDDDDEVKDGETIRVPIYLCDATQHRPRYGELSDEQRKVRQTTRDAYVRDLANAWRSPRDAAAPDEPGEPDEPDEQRPLPDPGVVEATYQAYRKALGQAWRLAPNPCPWEAPPADLAEAGRVARLLQLAPPPKSSSAPLLDPRASSEAIKAVMRRGDGDARAAARDARDTYVARLGDAWRTSIRERGEPDLGSRPEEMRRQRSESDPSDPRAAKTHEREIEAWKGRDPAELARDLEAKRAATHREFSRQLENAWQRGV
jgi:hypothetical protein